MAAVRTTPAVGVMTTHRFFLPPESFEPDQVSFPDEIAHQIRRVLRLRAGDVVIALDGSGMEYVVRLHRVSEDLRGTVEDRRPNAAEPSVFLVLYVAMLKAHKLELVLQKCTEVGVSSFVPVTTERSVAHEPGPGRQRRFAAIVREAAEQSGRGVVPVVHEPLPFRKAVDEAMSSGPAFLLWERERDTRVDRVTPGETRVSVFVGPEGGFTEQEVREAVDRGATRLSLGQRILRAETAAIVGSALVLARLGDP